MAGDGESAWGVERHSIGAGLAAAVGSGSFVAAGLEEDGDPFAGSPAAGGVGGNFGEEETAVDPDGAFDPGEAGGHAVELGVGRNDAAARWVGAVDLKRRGGDVGWGGWRRGRGGGLRGDEAGGRKETEKRKGEKAHQICAGGFHLVIP